MNVFIHKQVSEELLIFLGSSTDQLEGKYAYIYVEVKRVRQVIKLP